ncbi:MAG: hypothetical protein EOO70_04525 [Myxococcaceae bacterium]|nr:MAG: hypothetical protein EOO70_04525 [Myxococcaceae bacterium]
MKKSPLAPTLATITHLIILSFLAAPKIAQAQLPSTPNILGRVNASAYAGLIKTNSKGLDDTKPAFGFAAEASVFTNTTCKLCPKEIGAGTAYLSAGPRLQIQDLTWFSVYWWGGTFESPGTLYFGLQAGYTKFSGSEKDDNDKNKSVVLEAEGIRGAVALGYQPFSGLFFEATFAGRYFPTPKAVNAPLSANPFGAFSASLSIGTTIGGPQKKSDD